MSVHDARRARVRAALATAGAEAMLVTKPENVRYLFGFTGSAAVGVVLPGGTALVVDGRYGLRAEAELAAAGHDATLVVAPHSRQLEALAGELRGAARVAVEANHVTMAQATRYATGLAPAELVATDDIVETVRLVKDEGELASLAAAAAIADTAFDDVLVLLTTSISERGFARRLDERMRELGAADRSFETIVASGPNSASPHASPTERVIEPGDLVVVDFGALVDGYHSDMTRTVWSGEPPPRLRPVYEAVRHANEAGRRAAVPGAAHADVYAACIGVLDEWGFPGGMPHPCGHNVGLEIHERPFLAPEADQVLVAGQVLAVEPAVYVPGSGGVRIEDMVVVRAAGSERLTHAPTLALHDA